MIWFQQLLYKMAQSAQNIEIMQKYSTVYCIKTNIPFGYLAFLRLVIWQCLVRLFGANSFGHLKPPDVVCCFEASIMPQILRKRTLAQ